MSQMVPRRVIDTFRGFTDISLDLYGISCTLFVPTNTTTTEVNDDYTEPEDWEYDEYSCNVYIEWSPNVHRLRALGVFVEDQLPILTYFPNQCTNEAGVLVDTDIIKGSYIVVPIEYIPDNTQKNNEFELTDIVIRGMHDAVIAKCWAAVPRRVKQIGS